VSRKEECLDWRKESSEKRTFDSSGPRGGPEDDRRRWRNDVRRQQEIEKMNRKEAMRLEREKEKLHSEREGMERVRNGLMRMESELSAERVTLQRLEAEWAESRSQLEAKKQDVEKLQRLVKELHTRVSERADSGSEQ
jgi:chromosome segregation ATPase